MKYIFTCLNLSKLGLNIEVGERKSMQVLTGTKFNEFELGRLTTYTRFKS